MPHVSRQKIKKEVATVLNDQLLTFLSAAQTKGEARVLAEELLTDTERLMLGKRLAIIVMLERDYSFTQIEELLAVTPQTIGRMYKELMAGKHVKLARYARDHTKHFKKNSFWSNFERILQAGMPPRAGKGRWKNLRKGLT